MLENNHSPNKLSPKFFFLSLGALVTLVASVVAFLNLIFGALNKKFPDALNSTYQYGYSTWDYESIRSALATLIIVFPVFLLLSYFWKKASEVNLGHIDAIIRKWMIYLILFLSGIVVVVDLVTLVKYFVAGEITNRFLLKVAATLVVALLAGSYYLLEMRKEKVSKLMPTMFAVLSGGLVLLSIIWSFSVIGSPKQQREWRLDERRTQDLQSIQWQVISYWQQKEALPADLASLSNPLSGFMVPVDPEFEKGLVYEYHKLGDMKFELCATYSAVMPQGWQDYGNGGGVTPMFYGERDMAVSSMPYPGIGGDSWVHDAGRKCFERTIDKDLYPPYPKADKVY